MSACEDVNGLTDAERDAWRLIRLHAGRAPKIEAGLVGLWFRRARMRSGSMWRVQVNLFGLCCWCQVVRFEVYEEYLRSLGPYRNA